MNSFDQERLPQKYLSDPDKIGWVDKYGNFLIQMPDHHVFMDDRNFFSRYMFGEKQRAERESRVEAFSKYLIFYLPLLEIVKEIVNEAASRYDKLHELVQAEA